MLPGVQKVGEGTAGFNVRGGKTDQNLILIDQAPIYYPSHFFGNFSAINADIISDANTVQREYACKIWRKNLFCSGHKYQGWKTGKIFRFRRDQSGVSPCQY